MIKIMVIETEDRISILDHIGQLANMAYIRTLNDKFCQSANPDCSKCNLRLFCEESAEVRDWAASNIEKYKDVFEDG